MRRLFTITILLFTITSLNANDVNDEEVNDTLEINAKNRAYNLNDYVRAFATPDSFPVTKVWDLISDNKISPVPKNTNPGMNINDFKYWVEFVLENQIGSDGRFFIELAYPQMDHIRLFRKDADGKMIKVHETGDRFVFDQRPVSHRNFILPIVIEKGKSLHFLMMVDKKKSVTRYPLEIYHESFFVSKNTNDTIYLGIYFGVLIILIVLSILTAIRLRKVVFGWYALHLAVFGFWFFSNEGYTYQYITSDYPGFNTHLFPAVTMFSTIAMILYVRSLFETYKYIPTLDLVFRLILYFFLGSYVFWIIFPEEFLDAGPVLLAIRYSLTFFLVTAAFYAAWRYRTESKLRSYSFIAAYSIFYFGIVGKILGEYGLFNEHVFIYDPLMIAFMVEVIVLSYTMVSIVFQMLQNRDDLINENTDLQSSLDNFKKNSEIQKNGFITLKSKALISTKELKYIKSDDHYLEFYLISGKKEIDRNTLQSQLDQLPSQFKQAHRSYIVNLDYVRSYRSNRLLLKSGEEIPLTRKFKKELDTVLQH